MTEQRNQSDMEEGEIWDDAPTHPVASTVVTPQTPRPETPAITITSGDSQDDEPHPLSPTTSQLDMAQMPTQAAPTPPTTTDDDNHSMPELEYALDTYDT